MHRFFHLAPHGAGTRCLSTPLTLALGAPTVFGTNHLPPLGACPHVRRLSFSVRRSVHWMTTTNKITSSEFLSAHQTAAASLFTNAKIPYVPGTKEEQEARHEAAKKEWKEFLAQPVDAEGHNTPSASSIERRLPSKKQLVEELPSAEELEKALKEGRIDAYMSKPETEEK